MKIREISDHLYLAEFKNYYLAGMTFLRLAEYYESPFKQIRGKHFTLEGYMDIYCSTYSQSFNYMTRWGGYNVPGNVVLSFLKTFSDLREKEKKMFDKLGELQDLSSDRFYLIGALKGHTDVIEHECAHGFYYLDKDYKRAMDAEVGKLRCYNRVCKKLKKMGYCKPVFKDESQAYLSTSSEQYLKKTFGISGKYQAIRSIFKKKYKGTL